MKEKIDELKAILSLIRNYRIRGLERFNKEFSKKTKVKIRQKNFPSRILNGEITFKGYLQDYLDDAIECAYDTLSWTKNKSRNIELGSMSYKSLIKKEFSAKFLEEILYKSNEQYFNDNINDSTLLLEGLYKTIDSNKLLKNWKTSYLVYTFYINYIRNISQYWRQSEISKMYNMLDFVLKTLEKDKEPILYFKALNLKGHLLRQSYKYGNASALYDMSWDFVSNSYMQKKEKEKLKSEVSHQMGISEMYEFGSNEEGLKEALKNLNRYLRFLKDEGVENKILRCELRIAELLVKINKIEKAEELIGKYESSLNFVKLPQPHQAMFLRINAEKYLKLGEYNKAIENFIGATDFSSKNKYEHQLELLNKLDEKYDFLFSKA